MKRSKTKTATLVEVNWYKLEAIFLKTFRGGQLTDEESKLITRAHKAHPAEYARRSGAVRAEEIARIRGMGRGLR